MRTRRSKPTPAKTPNLPQDGNLLTKEQIADFLNVTPRTIETWMTRGLPHYKLGSRRTRFDRDQVRRYLDEKCAA